MTLLQGAVIYASPLEAFATGIKMESSDQRSHANQGIETNSERLIAKDQRTFLDAMEAWLHFVLWTPVNQAIKSLRMEW